MLREGEFGKSCTDAWRSLFFMDGHSLWRMLSKGELAGIRDVWEKAAAYTSRDAGNAGKRAGSEKGNRQEWYELQQKEGMITGNFCGVLLCRERKSSSIWKVLIIFPIALDCLCMVTCHWWSLWNIQRHASLRKSS
ncbi:hypothetical protein LC724_04520 [Blautia sp. RD014234]|nr:hypothetical protein [Blautia parvula]